MNDTERFARKVVGVDYDDFDDELIATLRGVVLDGVSTMLVGSREPLAVPLMRYMEQYAGGPCTVVGYPVTLRPQEAAYTNATFGHAADYELMSIAMHPTSPTLPVILALAQTRAMTGREALEALAAAFETMARINVCVVHSCDDWIRALRHPGSMGPFGSAAAAGKLIDLTVEQMQMAFGIAASRASGLRANIETMTKASHSGHAARSGMEAALLVAEGYTASTDIFGALHGFSDTYYDGELDLSLLAENFGDPYAMVEPGLTIKTYPSQYPTHWSIEAALELVRSNEFSPDQIERVVVEVGDNESAEVDTPATGLAGKFSVRYTVAAALLDGRVVIDTFSDERHRSADIQDMIQRTEVIKRPEVRAADPTQAWWSRVTVVTNDGVEHTARVDRPLGIWDNPVGWEFRIDKIRDCARRVFDTIGEVDAVLEQIEHFEQLDDVGSFVRMLEG